jgi:hypothetical protein
VSRSRWATCVHEFGGHTLTAYLLGCPVKSSAVNANHGGLTTSYATPWRGVQIAVAGLIAEELLLDPEDVDPTLSWIDAVHAEERARKFCEWSDVTKAARFLAPPPSLGSAPPVEKPVPTHDPEAAALVNDFMKARRPRTEARWPRIVEHAKRVVRDRTSAHLVAARWGSGRLHDAGSLGEQELLDVCHEALERQRHDDRRYGGRR